MLQLRRLILGDEWPAPRGRRGFWDSLRRHDVVPVFLFFSIGGDKLVVVVIFIFAVFKQSILTISVVALALLLTILVFCIVLAVFRRDVLTLRVVALVLVVTILVTLPKHGWVDDRMKAPSV